MGVNMNHRFKFNPGSHLVLSELSVVFVHLVHRGSERGVSCDTGGLTQPFLV